MQSEKLIQTLHKQTEQLIAQAEELKGYDLETLSWRANPQSWNVLECLEHLNLYGDYYLPVIAESIRKSSTNADREFSSGMLGNYFAQSMLPKEKLNKMKTFKDKNPLHSNLDKSVIDRFISQQVELLALLDQSRKVSLNRVKIPISIARFIKLKLGDTFQFFINHMLRHFSQIERIQRARKLA